MIRDRWRGGILAAFAAWGLFWGGWGALLPAIKAATGATEARFGLALFGVAAGALPAMLAAGPLADRFGTRALTAALLAFGVVTVLPGAVTSLPLLAATLVLLGATSGALDVCLNSAVAAYEAETGQRLFNTAHAAFPLAVVVAGPAVGLARQAGAGPGPILLAIGALVALAAPLTLGAPSRPQPGRPRASRPRVTAPLLGLGGLAAGILLIENAVEQWSAIHLEGSLRATPFVAGLGPALYMGMLFAGRLAAEAAGDRLPAAGQIALAGLAAAVGTGIAALAGHPAAALLGFGVAGFGMAGGIPTLWRLTGQSAPPAERGAAIATATAISYAGYLASPPLVGAIAGAAGLRVAWLALAGAGLVLAAGGVWVRGVKVERLEG